MQFAGCHRNSSGRTIYGTCSSRLVNHLASWIAAICQQTGGAEIGQRHLFRLVAGIFSRLEQKRQLFYCHFPAMGIEGVRSRTLAGAINATVCLVHVAIFGPLAVTVAASRLARLLDKSSRVSQRVGSVSCGTLSAVLRKQACCGESVAVAAGRLVVEYFGSVFGQTAFGQRLLVASYQLAPAHE